VVVLVAGCAGGLVLSCVVIAIATDAYKRRRDRRRDF
jgi:hypothetical protein